MKEYLRVLTLIILISTVFSYKHKTHHKKLLFKARHHNSLRNFKKQPKIIIITDQQKKELDEQNKKAEQIYSDPSTRMGRDTAVEATYKSFYVKVMNQDLLSSIANDRPRYKDVMLNSNTISVLEKEKSYRGIEFGLNLQDLVHSGDDPSQGKCCSGISDPTAQTFSLHNENGFYPKTLHCIDLSAESSSLKLCSINPVEIAEFRSQIIIQVIKSHMKKLGIPNVNVIVPDHTKKEFLWHEPETWDSLCKSGKYQSPINLSRSSAQAQAHMAMLFVFSSAPNANAVFEANEMEVRGSFGSMIHKLEIGQKKFGIHKIKFKFPSEHTFDGGAYDLEIQLYMSGNVFFA